MKIAIASDHGGFELKEQIYNYLKEKNYDIVNFGVDTNDSCDYPVYAQKVCNAILKLDCDRGILICGSGIGMSIAANRYNGIMAACVSDVYSAKMSRAHNNSNILCFGQRVVGNGLAKEIVDAWLETEFEGGRHLNRINMINK